MNSKIAFCGGGAMAEGILGGLLGRRAAEPGNITVADLQEGRRSYLRETYQVCAVERPEEAAEGAGMVVIAVNPAQVPGVAGAIRPVLRREALVLSIACGVTLGALEGWLGPGRKILRVMPNTLIQSGSGFSGVCANGGVGEEDRVLVEEALSALGQILYVPEGMFETFTAFSCAGPLWFYKTAEALIDAGVHAGFSRAESRNMVIKNMLGTAQVLEATGAHPARQADDMTSPGGVTIEALQVLHQQGFAGALMTSVDAAVRKANGMRGG